MAWDETTGLSDVDELLGKLPLVSLLDGLRKPSPEAQPKLNPTAPAVSLVPGSSGYNAALGATSQPRIPPAKNVEVGAPPELGAPSTPAVSLTPATKPSASEVLQNLQAPKREDFPVTPMPAWKKALGALASVAAGTRDPKLAGETARTFFGSPQAAADKRFSEAQQEYNQGRENIVTGAALDEKAAQTREANARATALEQPKPEKPEDQKVGEYTNEEGHPTFVFRKPTGELYEQSVGGTAQKKEQLEKVDKKIDEFTDENNNRVNVMQRPDGTTYNVTRGKSRTEGQAPSGDAEAIADSIIRGEQPPDLKGLYRNNAPVRAALAKKGYNLVKAEEDWQATQKYMATLNGSQQTRLRQAVESTKGYLDQVERIYNQWQQTGAASGWKVFNKASLATAKQLPGEAGSLAHNLEAALADVTSDLGTVYKGGNSSTDESLKLAALNLSGDWNEQTFKDAVKRLREGIQIRENSMKFMGPAGVSGGNPYTPPGTQPGSTLKNPY